MEQLVKIKSIDKVTHDVFGIVTEKPSSYTFKPGQATDVSIDKDGWKDKKNPFTFTCLPEDDYLEFMIKTYPAHKGVTNQVHKLKKDDELIIREAFGAIAYQQEGMFIAGGAGITPFISIFRDLKSKNQIGDNQLIFANKTKADIILEQELKELLGSGFINILSDEEEIGYANGFITEKFINLHTRDLKKAFYLCGPPPMVSDIVKQLTNLGVSEKSIIKEEF